MSAGAIHSQRVFPLVEGEHDDIQVVRLTGDRFVLTVETALEVLSLASDGVRFQAQFTELMNRMYSWVDSHRDSISAAYLSVSVEGLTLLVVQRDVPTDHELEEEMVELDIDVVNSGEFDLVPFNTLLVPRVDESVLQSFLSSGQVMGHPVNAEQDQPPHNCD